MATRAFIGGQSVEFDLSHLKLHEAIALQKASGWRPPQLSEALAAQDMVAMAALVWVLLRFRMGHDELSFEDVCEGRHEVDLAEVRIEMDEEPDPPVGGGVGEVAKTSP